MHGGAPCLALTPAPSPTQWERGAARSPSPAGRARGALFALTPSPSPARRARGMLPPPAPALSPHDSPLDNAEELTSPFRRW